jgi:hypothetical protein
LPFRAVSPSQPTPSQAAAGLGAASNVNDRINANTKHRLTLFRFTLIPLLF